MLNGDGDEEEEDESEEENEESEEEDEEDDVEPMQAKGRQLSSAASAQKKALSRKEAQSSFDDDDSHKETPVKVTVLAAPAVPTTEGKEPLASKSVLAKDPTPKAMEMETSQRVVEQNGAQDTPAVASVRNVVLSDEEHLSFLRDMRGTCVKLVEEAKTQSLLISERIFTEVCAKTTQIVQDATGRSSQIMEELRMVIERLGAIAGQDERMNSSGINYSGNLFQGMVVINLNSCFRMLIIVHLVLIVVLKCSTSVVSLLRTLLSIHAHFYCCHSIRLSLISLIP